MDYFKFIPEEITLEILSRVTPTESALGCKSVCKAWRNIICYQPSFSKMHLHHLNHDDDSGMLSFIFLTEHQQLYYFEYNDDKKNHDLPTERSIRKINITTPPYLDDTRSRWRIIGSWNGLICLHEEKLETPYLPDKTYVCNPITKEYITLPKIKTDLDNDICWTGGFGYVSSTNQYKVVRILFMLKTEFVQVHIYTLGSGNGWRNLGNFNLGGFHENLGKGIFLNGVLYWLYFDSNETNDKIVNFDLAEEKFCQHISLPPFPSNSNYKLRGVLGFLFLAVEVIQGVGCYDIWVLKKQKENQSSWVWRKEYRVDHSKLFAAMKTGNVLTYSNNFINIVDPKTSTSKMLLDLKEPFHQVIPHKNTLVSLKQLGEEAMKIVEPIELKGTDINL